MMARVLVLMGVIAAGCSDTRLEQRQPTQDDAPFGGGFPSSHHPGGANDPADANLRRTEIRPRWRGDNGSPETRVNTGGDARLETRTQ